MRGHFSRPTNSANYAFSGTTSLVTLLIVWGLSSELLQTDVFRTFGRFCKSCEEALNGELWVHLSATLGRVLAALATSLDRWRFYWCASRPF